MPKTELKESIEGLKAEAEKLEPDNEFRTMHLQGIIKDVELRIIDVDSEQETTVTLVADIEKVISEYEVEYPKVTRVLNRIMNLLSNMGI